MALNERIKKAKIKAAEQSPPRGKILKEAATGKERDDVLRTMRELSGRAGERAKMLGLTEVEDVSGRCGFDRFAPLEERLSFTGSVAASGQFMDVAYQFHACEDPRDDKFLDLAYAAGAA